MIHAGIGSNRWRINPLAPWQHENDWNIGRCLYDLFPHSYNVYFPSQIWISIETKPVNKNSVAKYASQVKNNGGVYFVPAFSGLFAPYWRKDARGYSFRSCSCFFCSCYPHLLLFLPSFENCWNSTPFAFYRVLVGLTQFSTREHICRAVLEAVCFQSRDVLEAMLKDTSCTIKQIRVDGGMTKSTILLQLQADIFGDSIGMCLMCKQPTPQTSSDTRVSLRTCHFTDVLLAFWLETLTTILILAHTHSTPVDGGDDISRRRDSSSDRIEEHDHRWDQETVHKHEEHRPRRDGRGKGETLLQLEKGRRTLAELGGVMMMYVTTCATDNTIPRSQSLRFIQLIFFFFFF